MATEKVDKKVLKSQIVTGKNDPYRFYTNDLPRNPDPVLLREGGGDYAIYEKLERDPHVYACLQTRKLALVGLEWYVEPATQKRKDRKIADFVEKVFYDMNFDQMRMDLMDAVMKGFAVVELIWDVRDGYFVVIDAKLRHPSRFVFDSEGNLRIVTREHLDGVPAPSYKFVVMTFDGQYGNLYGRGLAQRIYWPVYFKKHGIKAWMQFVERFGAPVPWGKYPRGTSKKEQDDLFDNLLGIQDEDAIITPEDVQIELLEARRNGSIQTYKDLVEFMNNEISKAILGQTLTTQTSEHGNYATAYVHQQVRYDILKADADAISETLNRTIVKWLVEINFGKVGLPKVWHKLEEKQDLKALAERDRVLVKDIGLRVPEDYFYETYGIPKPTEEQEVVSPPQNNAGMAFAEGEEDLRTEKQKEVESLVDVAMESWEKQLAPFKNAILEMARKSKSYEEFIGMLEAGFPPDVFEMLLKALRRTGYMAELMGRGAGDENTI